MKKSLLISDYYRACQPWMRVAFFAGITIASALPSAGKKGGNGGGNSGGDDPPPPDPDPVPFHYQVQWLDPKVAGDSVFFRDVSPDGTVVGSFRPGDVFGSQIAIIRFADGEEINLEDLLIGAGEVPADWRVTSARRICLNSSIGVHVYEPNGRLYTGALTLNADRTIQSFALLEGPEGEDAFLQDASESGEFLIATGEITDGIGSTYFGGSVHLSVWNPWLDSGLSLPGPVSGGYGGWFFSSISDFTGGAALVIDSRNDYTFGAVTALPEAATTVATVDVGADGTVLATIEGRAGTHRKRDPGEPTMLARWLPGSNSWETILPCTPNTIYYHPFVNGAGEIAGSSDGELYIFHDSFGVQYVDNMIAPVQSSEWDAGANYQVYGLSDPVPTTPYSGVILGRVGGTYFTLTPVVLP